MPDVFSERSYHEHIEEFDGNHDGEIWFVGHLEPM
jgi:hypothetical protein